MEKRSQSWTLTEVAAMLNGELHGPPDLLIERPAPADSDDGHAIAFSESEEYLRAGEKSGVGALLIKRDASSTKPHIKVDSPRMAFGMLLARFSKPLPIAEGVHPAR